MVMGWFVLVAIQFYHRINGDAQPKSVAWLGAAGGLTFLASWLWALVTSLSLLREARANEGLSHQKASG